MNKLDAPQWLESPYMGATVRVDLDKGHILSRVEGSYYNAQKLDTEDGYGLSASALAGAKFGTPASGDKVSLGALWRFN